MMREFLTGVGSTQVHKVALKGQLKNHRSRVPARVEAEIERSENPFLRGNLVLYNRLNRIRKPG